MPAYLPALALIAAFLPDPAERPAATPAQVAHAKGQVALDADKLEDAIGHFRRSLALDPGMVQNHLGIASAHLARSEDREAVPHLRAYLSARPNHVLIRMPYADALERTGDVGEARRQIETFVAGVQPSPAVAESHLITCHTRLMELCERQGDDHGERLNRGIGLYLLARKRAELGGPAARKPVEELYCKAAAELTLAKLSRPAEARAYWYLAGVWHELGQHLPETKCLREAAARASAGDMTANERRELHLRAAARGREGGR